MNIVMPGRRVLTLPPSRQHTYTSTNILYIHAHTAEMLRTGVVPSPSKSRMMRLTATDGTGDALKGVCVFFIRPSNVKSVTQANIAEELHCGSLDASDGRTVLQVLEEYLSEVMLPVLQKGQNWGALQPTQVDNFLTTLKAYINFLKSESVSVTTHCYILFYLFHGYVS